MSSCLVESIMHVCGCVKLMKDFKWTFSSNYYTSYCLSLTPSPCRAGYYSLGSSQSCKVCPAGYSCASASTNPTACSAGSYSTGGQQSCTACPVGKACPSTTTATDSFPCASGRLLIYSGEEYINLLKLVKLVIWRIVSVFLV